MKTGVARFVVQAAIVALAIAGASTGALAQCTVPNYSPDFTNTANNQACLSLNGFGFYNPWLPTFSPSFSGGTTVLRLTPNQTYSAGSAWYHTAQPVAGPFTTAFSFQLWGANAPDGSADGIAFLIQNSSLSALGPYGCGLGFGDAPDGLCANGVGIPNSLAVEFDSFQNPDLDDPNGNHVAIQSCGMGPNSVENPPLPGSCQIGNNSLVGLKEPNGNPLVLADGTIHNVTITFNPNPSPATCTNSACPGRLDVILDGNDLFSGGVPFDIASIGLTSGDAFVGFTAGTGNGDDNQDILSFTFQPGSQSTVVTTGVTSVLTYTNASGTPVYDYTAKLNSGTPAEITVTPILMSAAACDAMVQKTFWPAQCFVYQNAENSGQDAAVVFAVSGPEDNFFANLGTDFNWTRSDNPFFIWPGIDGILNPFPGWLKAPLSNNPLTPCTGVTFQSNQVISFSDPGGHTLGGSGGGTSCWVATYFTPGEALPGDQITSPKPLQTFALNSVQYATYTCSNPTSSKPSSSSVGPYSTLASCSQSELFNSGFTANSCNQTLPLGYSPSSTTCTGLIDTKTKGLHTLLVTSIDTTGNTNQNAVVYNVH